MVRNGDLFRYHPEVNLQNRINGDLQTHTLFLLASLAVACGALSWLIGRTTGVWWAACLFPVVFSMANKSLCENLLVNYCDSGEIGQLLFISLYLLCLSRSFKGNAPGAGREIAAAFFLVLAYGMKETSMVILPAVLGVLILRVLPVFRPSRTFKWFVARHVLMQSVLLGVLLTFVWLNRSGAYVAQNYQVQMGLMNTVVSSWHFMALPSEVIYGLIMGLITCGVILILKWHHNGQIPEMTAGTMLLLLMCALATAFFVINLPWKAALCKYYLPSYLFISAAVVMLLAMVSTSLREKGFAPVALLWVAGSIIFMLRNTPAHRADLINYYRAEYEYRKLVPFVAKDIAASTRSASGIHSVQLVAGNLFQEGALPFWRHINRFYGLNIAQSGHIVSRVSACERNYFLRYPGHGTVDFTLNEHLPEIVNDEVVYLLGDVVQNEKQRMSALGYGMQWEKSVGNPGMRIAKYSRVKP